MRKKGKEGKGAKNGKEEKKGKNVQPSSYGKDSQSSNLRILLRKEQLNSIFKSLLKIHIL